MDDYECWAVGGMIGKVKPKYLEKSCPSATLFTKNPRWPYPGSNPVHLSGKPETNLLIYDTAHTNANAYI
jgi:hypothetical protein